MGNFIPSDSRYYTKRQKVMRDLVHEYVHLTAFEISLIDTPEFQRLRDIKQVTAAYVFPNANHTRFEHSLGTFELTRRAIDAVINNGLFVSGNYSAKIHPSIVFSTLIAALLHDIGHSPFSHLGEKQFCKDALSEHLFEELRPIVGEEVARKLSKEGANHEKLSCLVIIENLWNNLIKAKYHEGGEKVSLDLEHICRCILGARHNITTYLHTDISECDLDLIIKNFCICLVSSKAFDMDSLDYIMRDTMYFALNSAKIDTERLFSSMYISKKGYPIFKRQAISVLKNIIDEKNNDYLYAINHHATLYSNFLYEFIFRRFKNDKLYDLYTKYSFDDFFSADAILDRHVSDSDVWAMFKSKYNEFGKKLIEKDDDPEFLKTKEGKSIKRARDLLGSIFSRNFLKPFWKDIIEFEAFRFRHFNNKNEQFLRICDRACSNGNGQPFRSEVVPAIVHIANKINDNKSSQMPQRLENHEFFLVEAQQKWLDKANLNELSIYIRRNEVRNPTRFGGVSPYEYEEKHLREVLPLSTYSEHYPMRGFYIYVKPISTTNTDVEQTYYDNLEKITVIVLSYFADDVSGKVGKLLSSDFPDDSERDTLKRQIYEEIWKIAKTELLIDK